MFQLTNDEIPDFDSAESIDSIIPGPKSQQKLHFLFTIRTY